MSDAAPLLLVLAIFLTGCAAGAALMTVLLGPDRDLTDGPWDPRR